MVQLYVGFPTELLEPPKQLKGFAKIDLQPGESQIARMKLNPFHFQYWNTTAQSYQQSGGKYVLYIGSSNLNIKLNVTCVVRPEAEPICGNTMVVTEEDHAREMERLEIATQERYERFQELERRRRE